MYNYTDTRLELKSTSVYAHHVHKLRNQGYKLYRFTTLLFDSWYSKKPIITIIVLEIIVMILASISTIVNFTSISKYDCVND